MKTTTVTFPDAQYERLEAEGRRQGLPPDILIRIAVGAYLDRNGASPDGLSAPGDDEVSEDRFDQEEPSPRLWFVGLGQSGHTDTSERIEEIIAEEWGDWMLYGGDPPKRTHTESTRSSDAAEAPSDASRPTEP